MNENRQFQSLELSDLESENDLGYDSSIEFILLLSSALFIIRRIIRYAIQISKNIPNTGFCRGYVLINTCTGVFY